MRFFLGGLLATGAVWTTGQVQAQEEGGEAAGGEAGAEAGGEVGVGAAVGGEASAPAEVDASAAADTTAMPAEAAPATADQVAIPGGLVGAFGNVGSLPGIHAFVTLNPGIILGAGLFFGYNGNGGAAHPLTGAASMDPDDKTTFGFRLHGEYLVYNKNRVALGPEVSWATVITPGDALSMNVVSPGLAFWYIPWDVGIGIGAAWDVDLVFTKGGDPVINLVSPALRLAYIFP